VGNGWGPVITDGDIIRAGLINLERTESERGVVVTGDIERECFAP
jgi:hypothetical protein